MERTTAGDRNTAHALERGRALRARLGLGADAEPGVPASYRDLSDALVFGEIWSRDGLDLEDRMIATLCALAAHERHAALASYVEAALRVGLTPQSVNEVFVQAGLYAGFVTAESALRVAAGVYATHGAVVEEPAPDRGFLDSDWAALGRDVMTALHGERASRGYADPDHPTTGALYRLAIEYGYGVLWNRPGLERRQRFVCAVATFTAIDHHEQLRKFSQSGLAHGLDATQVIEIITQTAPYSGFPRALNALVAVAPVIA